MLIDDGNSDIVHHLFLYDCNSSSIFDNNNLPDGAYDEISSKIGTCSTNVATGWAVGGDPVRFLIK